MHYWNDKESSIKTRPTSSSTHGDYTSQYLLDLGTFSNELQSVMTEEDMSRKVFEFFDDL